MSNADIIARLEAATGPDRQLDRMIEETLPGVRQHDDKRMVDDGYVLEANGIQAYLPAHYTASIDAALTLVPEGCQWTIEQDSAWVRWLTKEDVDEAQGALFQREGKCTAIALCIACLRARLSRPALKARA